MTPQVARAGRALQCPRLGFLGVGWIGRNRMRSLAESAVAEVAAVADPSPECRDAAREVAPEAAVVETLDELLDRPLDGLVIATPSALHAEHSIAALARGLAVFCQKPLARTADEAARVVAAARAANRLLGVDLSYRQTAAVQRIRELMIGGELGRIYAANLVFHNAYGPDRPWFYDRASSGGGCVMDLGIHLVDLALWLLGFPEVVSVDSRIFAGGAPLDPRDRRVEDFASVQLILEGGTAVQLGCSWRLPAGRDAVIEAAFYGTGGGAALRNVGGSFFDFTAERYRGTATEILAAPPDDWGGRALVAWARALAAGAGFDAGADRLVTVHRVLDAIYGRGEPT